MNVAHVGVCSNMEVTRTTRPVVKTITLASALESDHNKDDKAGVGFGKVIMVAALVWLERQRER